MEQLIVSDKERFRQIIENIKTAGGSRLHVLTDFDRTLTRAYVDGIKTPSLISILRDGNYLTVDYAIQAQELFDKYHPLELSTDLSMPEKKKAMADWWRSHFKLLIDSKLTLADIRRAMSSGKVKLRSGVPELFKLLEKNSIPLVIMSASGLGAESVSLFLGKESLLTDNVQIISNSFIWNEDGTARAVREPIIHVYSKDETMIQWFPAFEKVKDRKNVILLGDSFGDVGMVDGFDFDNLLKIGFLNENAEKDLAEYQKKYDAVIVDDGGMESVVAIVGDVLS